MHDNDYRKAIICCILREMLKSLMNARAAQQQQQQQQHRRSRTEESQSLKIATCQERDHAYCRRGMNRIIVDK